MKKIMRRTFSGACILCLLFLFGSVACDKNNTRTEEPIRIGSVLFLSGPAASYGEMQKSGFSLALDEINAAGGIKGKRLEVIYEDSAHDQQKAVAAVKKLIAQDRVPIVVEVTGSGEAVAVAPVFAENKVVFLSAIDSTEKLSGINKYFFRIMPSDAFQGRFLGEWGAELGWKKAAVIYVKNEWGEGIQKSVRATFEKTGGTITSVESSTDQDIDFRTQLTKIKNGAPDGIFLLLYPEAAGRALKQAKQLEIQKTFIGGDALSGEEVAQMAGEASDGLKFCLPAKSKGTAFERFSDKYQAQFHKPPSVYAIKSYDAMMIAADALRAAGPSSEGIREYLSKLKDYQGLSGVITLDSNGDIVTQRFERFVYRGGKYFQVDK